ncbi:MAG: tetratricopeptide repeat protein [Planctomycetota bacterium]
MQDLTLRRRCWRLVLAVSPVLLVTCGDSERPPSKPQGATEQRSPAPSSATPAAPRLESPAANPREVGTRLLAEGRVAEALGFIEKAIQATPEDPFPYMLKGQALLEDFPGRDPRQALSVFARVADRLASAKLWIARIHLELEATSLAEAALADFFGAAPPDAAQKWPLVMADAHALRAEVARCTRRLEAAREDLAMAETLFLAVPRSVEAQDPFAKRYQARVREGFERTRLNILLADGQAEEALPRARERVALDPEAPGAREDLARVLEALGQGEETQRERRIAELLRTARRGVGDAAVAIGDVEATVRELDQLLGGYPRGRVTLARAYLQRGQPERAIELCKALRQELESGAADPKLLAECWFVEGSAHFQMKRGPEAIEAYGKAARLEPSLQGRYQELRAEIERLMAQPPPAAGK